MTSSPKKEQKLSIIDSTAICLPNCKGLIINENQYCWHLEKDLKKLRASKSIRAARYGSVDHIPAPETAPDSDKTELAYEDMEIELLSYGLQKFEVELLMLRFYTDLPFTEIARLCGWTSKNSAQYHFKQALKKLRERGFRNERIQRHND